MVLLLQQSELDLAQKYVSEYFDEINSTIESTLSANVENFNLIEIWY